MKEQSHKAEMSSLLRADFERLRARGVATTLASPVEVEPAEETTAPPCVALGERAAGLEPGQAAKTGASGGWLRRLLASS